MKKKIMGEYSWIGNVGKINGFTEKMMSLNENCG